MELKDILRTLRQENGYTQQYLADYLGIKRPTYTRYEGGTNEPDLKTLEMVAKLYNVTIDYLMGRDDTIPHELSEEEVLEKFDVVPMDMSRLKPIPVIASIRAGYGGIAYTYDEDEVTYEYADVRRPEEYVFFKISGDSMEPDMRSGDYALVHKQNYANDGDIIAAVYNGEEGTLKQYYEENEAVVLHAFNSKYRDIIITGDELDGFRIVGKAVRIVRNL